MITELKDGTKEVELTYRGDLTELKDGLIKAQKIIGRVPYTVDFITGDDRLIKLYHGKRAGWVYDNTHHFNGVSFLNKEGYCNCMTQLGAVAYSVFYIPKGRNSTGWTLPLQKGDKLIVKRGPSYESKWNQIAQSMIKHNINLSAAQDILNHLDGTTEHINGFDYRTKYSKPRVTSFKNIMNGRSIDQMIKEAGESSFGAPGCLYTTYYDYSGVKRDKRVSLILRPDKSVGLHASSEFKGCVNGDYYLMYSPTMAVFIERD